MDRDVDSSDGRVEYEREHRSNGDLEMVRLTSELEDYESGPTEYEIATYPADFTLEVLHAKLKNEGSVVVLASNIMITLGLLGTVSGLISSIGGLQATSGVAGLMGGVTKAIDGRGVAFYTTLIGSMLGGITLRILHFYVDKQVDTFVSTMAEVVETRIIPSLRLAERSSDVRDIALATVAALQEMGKLKEKEDETAKLAISA